MILEKQRNYHRKCQFMDRSPSHLANYSVQCLQTLRTNITDLGSIVGASSIQKRSPVAGDDHTKGDNHTQNTQDGSGTHTGKYARMKSGLKPIRPSGYSASSLNPTTPGRPGFNPVTPGKLPQTPRLNFKENEPSRFVLHEFPSTPK